jgi:hypothetical protein
MVVESRHGEFVISPDPARLDLDVFHEFLTNCYWAKGIPREVVARSVEHSLCFGVYDGTGEKTLRLAKGARHRAPRFARVGFARIVSDFANCGLAWRCVRTGVRSRARVGEVADGVHYAAYRIAEFAALDSFDPGCAWTLLAVWLSPCESA